MTDDNATKIFPDEILDKHNPHSTEFIMDTLIERAEIVAILQRENVRLANYAYKLEEQFFGQCAVNLALFIAVIYLTIKVYR